MLVQRGRAEIEVQAQEGLSNAPRTRMIKKVDGEFLPLTPHCQN
jgi:hypothetical protein